MRIVFQKVARWEKEPHAEAELAFRMLTAAHSVESVKAIASSDMNEIEAFQPDVVVPLHFFIPKLFDAFTVGCMWNPESAIERNHAWDNIKSYDGYGVASESQEQLVRALKFRSPAPYLLSKLYPSTNVTTFKKPENFFSPVYIGSNWNKEQKRDFFSLMEDIRVFGPRDRWSHLADSIYQGEVPIDGKSLLNVYHESGIGLALHNNDHNIEGIPSMRPFEIAASSSVMISDKNSFVQQEFGENALYLDTSLSKKEVVEQLNELISWIRSHPQQAQEMAEVCHNIFIEKFSLEILLRNLIQDIHQFNAVRIDSFASDLTQVEIIVRSDGKHRETLLRALKSINRQSYRAITALLVYRGPTDLLPSLKKQINEHIPDLNVKYICTNDKQDRSSQFYSGLRATTASYIGYLDHDDVLFSDHVSILADCLSKNPSASLAYSGSVRIWEAGKPPGEDEIRKLAYFYEIDNTNGIKGCITSNSYIVRREIIPWYILNNPIPEMSSLEDSIFLKMIFCNSPNFIFSEKVTCAFYWRVSKQENSAFDKYAWNPSKKTLDLIKMPASTIMAYYDNATNGSKYFFPNFSKLVKSIRKDAISFIQRRINK